MSGTLLDLGNILVDETVPVSVIMHLSRKNYSPKWSEYSVDRQLMFFKNLLIFNRKIIGLQYCVGFCHTSTWSSHQSPPSWLQTPAAEQMNSRRLFVKCRRKKHHRVSGERLITEKPGLNSVKEMRVETLRERTRWMEMSRNSILGGEGNGNPLQCSCLENPRDGGTWWAAVFGVAQTEDTTDAT